MSPNRTAASGRAGRLRSTASRAIARLRSGERAHVVAGSAPVVDEFAAESFSQEGEDMILRLLLGDRAQGFYVDVGAHHPRRFSNTTYFHSRGWRGVNIDADREAILLFEQERPGDINIHSGVGEREGEFELTQYFERALSTFDPRQVERVKRENPGYEVSARPLVRVRRLETILDEHLQEGTRIDFLNVDVEGMDTEVLRSNDWGRFRPEFVVVEVDIETLAEVTAHPTAAFLAEQGYRCVAKTPRTAFFRSHLPTGR